MFQFFKHPLAVLWVICHLVTKKKLNEYIIELVNDSGVILSFDEFLEDYRRDCMYYHLYSNGPHHHYRRMLGVDEYVIVFPNRIDYARYQLWYRKENQQRKLKKAVDTSNERLIKLRSIMAQKMKLPSEVPPENTIQNDKEEESNG